MLVTFRGKSVKEFLFATLQLLIDHLVCRPVFCITVVTSNFSGDLRLNTQFKSVDNMNCEQLILKNNFLNKIVVVLWFNPFFVRLWHPIQKLASHQETGKVSMNKSVGEVGGVALTPYFKMKSLHISQFQRLTSIS